MAKCSEGGAQKRLNLKRARGQSLLTRLSPPYIKANRRKELVMQRPTAEPFGLRDRYQAQHLPARLANQPTKLQAIYSDNFARKFVQSLRIDRWAVIKAPVRMPQRNRRREFVLAGC